MEPETKDIRKPKKGIAYFLIFLALAASVFAVYACIDGQRTTVLPEEAEEVPANTAEVSSKAAEVSSETLQSFFSYLEQKDWEAANSLLADGTLSLDTAPDGDHAAALWQTQQDSWVFSVSDDMYFNGQYMVGTVSVRAMDFSTLSEDARALISERLEHTVAAATLKSEVYDEEGNYKESLLLSLLDDSFYELIADPEPYLATKEIRVRTEPVNGEWRVCSDDELIGALTGVPGRSVSSDIAEIYDSYANSLAAEALSGLMYIPIIYSLPEGTVVAPAPDKADFHRSKVPADTAEAVETASAMAGGQELFWSADTKALSGQNIDWYLDETIFAITWRQKIQKHDFTFCEVVVAHPSQFRRYLTDNSFSSSKRYKPTQMAKTVNAVVAISGDFYNYRKSGIVVYQRELFRSDGKTLDTCFVDSSGDLNFVRRGALKSKDEIRAYIEENDIVFSLSFGPIMIEDGVICVPKGRYPDGEIHDKYTRCAICQLGEGHYLFAVAKETTLDKFAEILQKLGVKKAYGLDGGQTATIVINGKAVNPLDHGQQRVMSDIIYFATALPDGE